MAISGYNSELHYSTDGGTSYIEVLNLRTLDPPSDEVPDKIETTHLKSPNRKKQYIPGFIEEGQSKFKVLWDQGIYETLKGFKDTGQTLRWKMVWGDGLPTQSNIVFSGYLTKCKATEFQRDQPDEIEGEIQVTGDVTYTAGT